LNFDRLLITASCAALFSCTLNESGNIRAMQLGDLTYGEPARAPFDEELRRACGSSAAAALVDLQLARMPYLQSVTGTSARVLWGSDGAPGALTLTPAGSAKADAAGVVLAAEPMVKGQFQASLAELEPGETYCYQLSGDGKPWTDWIGFRTAPAPGEPVRLISLGDLGTSTGDQLALADVMMEFPAQALLFNGDVAYPDGTLGNFADHFFPVYQPLLAAIPSFAASGNHEYRTADAAPFREVFALPENGGPEGLERWYSFDWGDVHVTVLDSEKVGPAQAEWLDADLTAAAAARWRLVVVHRPPFSSGDHGDTASLKQHFVPLFERHGVHLVLAGHDHNYERFHPKNGVVYVVSGGGGRGTRPVGRSADTAFSLPVIHFVMLEATGEALTGWAIDGTGQVFDSFQIR
jgi:hypothetical protein